MKSNITIKSNIYIRNTNFISTDVNFVKNVQGLNALQKVKKYLSSNSRAKLTTEQLDFLKLGITCELAKDGQSTHGTILKDGKIQFVCRCEYSQCNHFNIDYTSI